MLLDELLALPPYQPFPLLSEMLKRAVLVSVNNVAKYYMEDNDQEVWDLEKDFPNIAPPWPIIAFEWSPPQYINSCETGFRPNSQRKYVRRMIFLMESHELQYLPFPRNFEGFQQSMNGVLASMYLDNNDNKKMPPPGTRVKWEEEIKRLWKSMTEAEKSEYFEKVEGKKREGTELHLGRGIRWVAKGFTIIQAKNGDIVVDPTTISWGITNDGNFIGLYPLKPFVPLFGFMQEISQEEANIYKEGASTYLHIPFLALSFMHCKNVALEENKPPVKLQEKRLKTGKKPLVKYYTLQIDPMREVLRREGASAKTGLRKALHICRGHFATYQRDAPLFGKFVGTFWKPMHLRGRAAHGVVLKDYSVKT
jgi:hypothetical protein